MKKRLVIIFLLIFLVSCTSKTESTQTEQIPALPQEVSYPRADPPVPSLETPQRIQETEQKQTQHRILIKRFTFDPANTQVSLGQEVIWQVDDVEKFHMIACYQSLDGKNARLFTSERLYHQKSFSFAFEEVGRYLCIDPVFGIRGNVTVVAPLVPITGSFVSVESIEGFGKSVMFLVGLVVLIALITVMSQYQFLFKRPLHGLTKADKNLKKKKRR